ncbi:MAG: hypothetical protein J6M95_03850 [Bacilli bacterium]|nr:hypothetical protein [Bacilli bacterium]
MSFSNKEIKSAKRKITIDSVIITFCWIIFLSFFIPTAILVNDQNIVIFKIISSLIAVISSWITIYIISNDLYPTISRKNVIKRILGYEEKTYVGVVNNFSNIRTVDKKIEAKELEITLEDDSTFIFYVDILDDYSFINIGDKVEIKARYHYLTEIHKL